MAAKTHAELISESYAGAMRLQNAHYAAAANYQWWSRILGLPSAMFGSVTTASMASLLGDVELSQTVKVASTVCGLISLFGGALMSTLNFANQASQHHAAAISWGALRGKFGRLSACVSEPAEHDNMDEKLQTLGEEWDQISRSAPVLYEWCFRKSSKAQVHPAQIKT